MGISESYGKVACMEATDGTNRERHDGSLTGWCILGGSHQRCKGASGEMVVFGYPWEGVKVYGSVGDAEGHQCHLYRFNLYYRLEAF